MDYSIQDVLHQFVDKAIGMDLLDDIDRNYTVNRLAALLEVKDPGAFVKSEEGVSLLAYMDLLVGYAKKNNIAAESQSGNEIMEASIMDLVTPLPSVVNRTFWDLYQEGPERATCYFYQLSRESDYIKTRNIARNIIFSGESAYGELEVTINLSKPEKDPVEIARAGRLASVGYPKCALCMENEGYAGHEGHAARANHRIVRLAVGSEVYGLQYSPYVYYNEHSIFLNEVHQPMVIDRKCFGNLLEIVRVLPHYFVGSNADLPRVGGSILAHDHYQGGRHEFPMERAEAFRQVELVRFPGVEAELLHWPMSVIRLRSVDASELVAASAFILDEWIGYSDEALGVVAYTGTGFGAGLGGDSGSVVDSGSEADLSSQTDSGSGADPGSGADLERHNTVTPIARMRDGLYEMDLVLRNNRVSEEFPDGIFHPHPDVHHIKKENIGLIEVMGLAVLPPRLADELEDVRKYLVGSAGLDSVAEYHQDWVKEIEASGLEITRENVGAVLEAEVTAKFARVLEDAGVFKQTEEGRAGFGRFVEYLNRERG